MYIYNEGTNTLFLYYTFSIVINDYVLVSCHIPEHFTRSNMGRINLPFWIKTILKSECQNRNGVNRDCKNFFRIFSTAKIFSNEMLKKNLIFRLYNKRNSEITQCYET